MKLKSLFSLLLFSSCLAYAQDTTLSVGDYAPDIILQDLDGESNQLSSLQGNVVLVSFWASWCKSCRENNPEIVRLFYKYGNKEYKNALSYVNYSVAIEKDKEEWQRAINNDALIWKSNVSSLNYWNCNAALLYEVDYLPYYLLLDKDGKILRKFTDISILDKYLNEYLQN